MQKGDNGWRWCEWMAEMEKKREDTLPRMLLWWWPRDSEWLNCWLAICHRIKPTAIHASKLWIREWWSRVCRRPEGKSQEIKEKRGEMSVGERRRTSVSDLHPDSYFPNTHFALFVPSPLIPHFISRTASLASSSSDWIGSEQLDQNGRDQKQGNSEKWNENKRSWVIAKGLLLHISFSMLKFWQIVGSRKKSRENFWPALPMAIPWITSLTRTPPAATSLHEYYQMQEIQRKEEVNFILIAGMMIILLLLMRTFLELPKLILSLSGSLCTSFCFTVHYGRLKRVPQRRTHHDLSTHPRIKEERMRRKPALSEKRRSESDEMEKTSSSGDRSRHNFLGWEERDDWKQQRPHRHEKMTLKRGEMKRRRPMMTATTAVSIIPCRLWFIWPASGNSHHSNRGPYFIFSYIQVHWYQ